MKKLISVIIVCLLLSSILVMPASAASFVLEEGGQVLRFYHAGGTYRRIDDSILDVEYTDNKNHTFKRTDEYTANEPRDIKTVKIKTDKSENIVRAEIHYNDGTYLVSCYLQENYLDEYQAFANDTYDTYTAKFDWPEDNFVKISKTAVSGKLQYLYKSHIESASNILEVSYRTDDGVLNTSKGALVILDDKCYFAKYENYGLQSVEELYNRAADASASAAITSAYEITDEATLSAIRAADKEFYSSDFGFLYNEDFTDKLSAIFLIILFAVLPLGVFVLFLILAIRSKTIYKKLFTIIYIASATLLGIVALLAIFVSAG